MIFILIDLFNKIIFASLLSKKCSSNKLALQNKRRVNDSRKKILITQKCVSDAIRFFCQSVFLIGFLAIKQKYSIAVDTMSKEVRPIGDFRLVKYAWFLLEHYYPAHDAVACEDGRAMHAYSFALTADEMAFYAKKIAQCKQEQTLLEKKYFAFA